MNTCDSCQDAKRCQYAFHPSNTDGNCVTAICVGCKGMTAPNGCVDDPLYCQEHGQTYPNDPYDVKKEPESDFFDHPDEVNPCKVCGGTFILLDLRCLNCYGEYDGSNCGSDGCPAFGIATEKRCRCDEKPSLPCYFLTPAGLTSPTPSFNPNPF